MFGLGPTELLIILGVVLLIFGPSRLPEIGRAIGRGLREFRSAANEMEDATKDPKEQENKEQEKPQ